MSRADDLADMESSMLAMRGLNNAVITASKLLKDSETGFLLVDASAAGFTLTLPPASRSMDIRVQRVDNSGNRLVVRAYGAEKVLFHTHLRPEGYPFFVLMGSGDYWHLRSDANGNWRLLDRLDSTPLGRPVFETTMAFSPGGWVAHTGVIYNRVEWPWAWDHAQASGMLTTEALRAGNEGCWTAGNGSGTFRSPEGRGEFIRMLDESRGIDAGRGAGSSQAATAAPYMGVSRSSETIGRLVTPSLSSVPINSNSHYGAIDVDSIDATQGSPYLSVELTAGGTTAAARYRMRPRNIAYPGRLKLI